LIKQEGAERLARIGSGYPFGRMAKAFVTSLTHEEEETRERAEGRVGQWLDVVSGMANGLLEIGTRPPILGVPAWVTPEVARGGVVTGSATAEIEPEPWERSLARRAGVAPTRRGLFAYHLSEAGLAELNAMLDSGTYEVRIPEEAALLTVAWLVAAGDIDAAVALAEEIAPFAGRLRFTPRPLSAAADDPSVVSRETAAEAGARLAARRENERVATMREALTVWNPFADEVLALWLQTRDEDRLAARFPAAWRGRAAALLARYRELAAAHTRCGKHRKPKENLAILLRALETVVAGRELEPRQAGLLRHAVGSMIARRGEPGSPGHRGLRDDQAAIARLPGHHALARVVAGRLAELPQPRGVEAVEPLLTPVITMESDIYGVPRGAAIPPSVGKVVRRALAGTPQELVEQGVVPSAEVLAELVPRIAATTISATYRDERLRALMAATYGAFRNRRSLPLLDLEQQARLEELPWVRAVAGHRARSGDAVAGARGTLVGLAELTLTAFPGAIVPNAMITELRALAREAQLDLPLVEELAADIFAGRFSAKFLTAAQLAGRMLRGSLYARYYGIDYGAVLAIDDVAQAGEGAPTSPAFDALCAQRAGYDASSYSVAASGTVIEQAQILTTHNLAALTGPFGVGDRMQIDWDGTARRAFERAVVLAGRLRANGTPRAVKDLAYAWRQTLFFLSALPAAEVGEFLTWARRTVRAQPPHVVEALTPVLNGMRDVFGRGSFDSNGFSEHGRRLLGWSAGPHWLLEAGGGPEPAPRRTAS
jgi:hypothetical protein